jgi:hypothetical protein
MTGRRGPSDDAEPAKRGGPEGDRRMPSAIGERDREESHGRGADRREPGSSAAAGPHAQPSLTNPDATPGAGTLPDPADRDGEDDIDADAATG